MNLHDEVIVFKDVCKTYRLYQSQWQMVREALGFKNKQPIPEFYALKNVNLTIKKGERIGLVGRNGAGKTTLLKLITNNFQPTNGEVKIKGRIQALMNMGVGFHPEFTGLQNIKSSLLYNGLNKKRFDAAVEDVIDFVELGEFIDQPLKTYSLGMQSRLYFAVATAIEPEILIVDEVLGAGDAYFSAKSADRMKRLTQSGCTLLLVSHSSAQILQFCEKAVWIECGEITMEGNTLEVVKSYEEFTKKLEVETRKQALESSAKKTTAHANTNTKYDSVIQSKWLREKLLNQVLSQHMGEQAITKQLDSCSISRWPSMEPGLKIDNIKILDADNQVTTKLQSGQSVDISITVNADKQERFDVYFVILIFTENGQWIVRHCSERFQLDLNEHEKYSVRLKYRELLLGQGKYIFSAAIYKILDLEDLSTARYYDLLARSFEFEVDGFHQHDLTLFHHPAEWESPLMTTA